MAYKEKLANDMREIVSKRKGVVEHKMFGALVFLVDGKMFCGTADDDIMLRIGKENYDDYVIMPEARPFDFTGREMRGLVYIDTKKLKSKAAFKKHIDFAFDYAKSLPPKKPKKRKHRLR